MLEAYYRQVLTDGFFHADPHPGNLMWWQDRIYFLDFGMVGEIDGDARSLLLLLLLAFWQEDEAFLAEVLLMLADESVPDLDREAFQAEVGGVLERFRHVSLRDLRLGPLIEELTRISLRHRVRMPASLALAGKAFGQMQQTTAELDPELDPFSAAGTFLLGRMMSGAREAANPRRALYEAQKLRLRLSRLLEGLERVVGARPGPGLEVRFRGTERLEGVVRRAGRRVALAVTGGCLLLGAAITAGSPQVGPVVPIAMGAAGAVVAAGLLADLVRSSE
jgi:predicted unusual protein kinase regulating ubiquinone biosynthesis (AarF/ABC1/UbiB family)